jgi:3-dehydroquinate dehydratase-2
MQWRESGREWRFAFINGPNMSMLGRRQGAVFGPISSIEDLNALADKFAATVGVSLTHCVSDAESEILHFIHETSESVDGYLINPAGLTHFGQATRDALIDTGMPYVEVHFANLSVWTESVAPGRNLQSIFSHTAAGVIEGLRHYGYFAGILGLALALDDENFLGRDAQAPAPAVAQQ